MYYYYTLPVSLPPLFQGDYFEQKSFLSGLMSVTTVIDRLHAGLLKDERYSCFLGLQNFPNVSKTDAQTCQVR